jgi:hypothetical protein
MLSLPPRITRYLLVALLLVPSIVILLCYTDILDGWRVLPRIAPKEDSILHQELKSLEEHGESSGQALEKSLYGFKPGVMIAEHNYTRKIVVPTTKSEDISWLDEELPGVPKAVYAVDDPRAPLHPPKNKGNEVMVYLSYIIDHYDVLADVNIFIHAHRWAWHNNDLLDGDTALMIRHLSDARVIREGYMNLRCQWYPGCPGWLHPNAQQEDEEKKEEMFVAHAWKELFPARPMPEVLGQPCCSQFAVSKDRITAIPLAEYTRLRRWILKTKIRDSMSGRVFEYLWQYLFTGQHTHCPDMHTCYCDGYGACFEDEEDFQSWFKTRFYVRKDEWELNSWIENEDKYQDFVNKAKMGDAERVERAPQGRIEELKLGIQQRWIELWEGREVALERGKDEKHRAKIAGREWIAGG